MEEVKTLAAATLGFVSSSSLLTVLSVVYVSLQIYKVILDIKNK